MEIHSSTRIATRCVPPLAVALSCALAWVLLGSSARSQTTVRVSVSSTGGQASALSDGGALSADGRVAAFRSLAADLVVGDTNAVADVFVREPASGTTTRVSVSSAGVQGNGASSEPSLSADGIYVAFTSSATNLVAGDTNAVADIFVRARDTLTTLRVSLSSAGVQGNGASSAASMSATGSLVAFVSSATNLVAGDLNGVADIFVRDLSTSTTTRVSVSTGGTAGNFASSNPSISADGRFVAFDSGANNLVAGDTNGFMDVFVHDRVTATTTRVSVTTGGTQGNQLSQDPSISTDGRFVAFESLGDLGGALDAFNDIYLHDRQTGVTTAITIVSIGACGFNCSSFNPSISADGRFIAFDSLADTIVPDGNSAFDVIVNDRTAGTMSLVSVSTGGVQGNSSSSAPAISADGRSIVFTSSATNLVANDTNAASDVFLRDRGLNVPFTFCFGDGSSGACPCANSGLAGRGCNNSAGTGGASLGASGSSSLTGDTLVLTASNVLANALSIFSQGTQKIAPVPFGDGLRCVGGTLKRLYTKTAVLGVATAPQGGDPSVSARSALLGDPIPMGASRYYYTYYRDASLVFCPSPMGNTFNITSQLAVVWAP